MSKRKRSGKAKRPAPASPPAESTGHDVSASLNIVAKRSEPPYCNPAIDEHSLLSRVVSHLFGFIRDAFPPDIGLRRVFEHILEPDDAAHEGHYATIEELRGLYDLFYAQPPEEQRRILNGWRVDEQWTVQSVRECIRQFAYADPQNFLFLSDIGSGQVVAGLNGSMEVSTGAVEVKIREGSTRDEVLATMQNLLNFLVMCWDDAITDPDKAEAKFAILADKELDQDLCVKMLQRVRPAARDASNAGAVQS